MGWLRLVGSLKLQVFFAKEPYKRDWILPKETYNFKESTNRSHPICINPYIRTNILTYTHTNMKINICMYVCTYIPNCQCSRTNMWTNICMYVYLHIFTHTYTHTHMHTYKYLLHNTFFCCKYRSQHAFFRGETCRDFCQHVVAQVQHLCYSVFQCVAVRCSTLQYVAVRCSALQCVAVRCSALQCVAVRCILL